MKKLLLIASFAIVGTTVANAQQLKFGPKAGYSLSMLKAEGDGESYKFDSKSTFYAGAFVEYKFSDKFGIQGEVLYSPMGGKEEESITMSEGGMTVSATAKSELKLGMVQIPVSAKYFPTENFAIAAGLNVGIVTSAESEYSISASGMGQNYSESGTEDIKDQVNSLNLAPFIGAEYTLNNGLFFDARYNLGVSNLIKNPEGNETLKNSFFQVGVGFKFGGK